ncbi:hypothetical protein [Dickeya dianthicola]|nr:hypothetical protein [Dickeya dianthicola]ATO35505.1 hypothetical protein DDI_4337 [Dickeya dianthicola RNS04.9]
MAKQASRLLLLLIVNLFFHYVYGMCPLTKAGKNLGLTQRLN